MLRTWNVRVVVSLLVVSMALVACGGEESPSEPTGQTTATDGGDGDGDVGVFDAAECANAVAAWSSAAAAAGAAVTGGSGDLSTSIDQLQAFASAAPEEIRDDLTLVYEAYGAFVTALEDAGYDPTSGAVPTADQLAAIQAASESLQGSDIEAATQRVSDWFAANCSG